MLTNTLYLISIKRTRKNPSQAKQKATNRRV